jgi:acetylornithine deacetylase/succinyl-diaminopimelate desuccinylase-like protein
MLSRAHGTDESIGISSLVSSTKIMLALAYDMLAAR